MEFHVSHLSRDRYQFDLGMFRYDGNVIFANFQAVRGFAQKINLVRAKAGQNNPVSAGELNALGILDEIMHYLIAQYREEENPALNQIAYAWLNEKIGEKMLSETLEAFCTEFPPLNVYRGEMTVSEYLSAENPNGKKNRYEVIEEMLILWITNRNPAAMKPFSDLFNEKMIAENSGYLKVMDSLNQFFKTLPSIENMTLVEYLLLPATMHPDSLLDQLDYIRLRWGVRLGHFLQLLLKSLDWIKEEIKDHGFGGPGPVELPTYGSEFGEDEASLVEYEAFSEDREWMPRLVLMAKNSYVWLDQLTKKYGKSIRKLNEIPDEELMALRDEGFTGLWLIGLWERSRASATIKQWCGNPEAIASAYSLADYRIADDLGGEEAFKSLKRKAWRYGIRLASDMVPNHMGIDSNWVLYHPDRFLSLPYVPFPSYTFNGGNLSPDPAIGLFLEDHYYSKEDAAVVFQRVDYHTGDVRYIYHGNDGTSMPWNDTAQLNYLDAGVREIVIQTILDVARRFPIIRFDAAMTLAKKHYQRLWFPEPGTGGDIATRAEYGMTKEEFDRVFPEEFWREVVDRVAIEAPDTLLLAEAFWLMEGYFVRTLGMHRVYNSAFMNLLRNEDNVQYRILLKSTLEYDPDILKRYVNFMNNPDEKTAAEQFGKGDKYFGICVLMSTMPGLPMFGHGQLEGFTEKYGMEYQRAYWDEQVDDDLMDRHRREIFPLLHQRRRFAEVVDFILYNFATAYGNIDENVFAYSNFGEGRHSLVVYHNRYGETKGFIKQSVPFVIKQDGDKIQMRKTLSEALHLHDDGDCYTILHDSIRGLYYLRPSSIICNEGLYFELGAYQYYVFNEVSEVRDDASGSWRNLYLYLDGAGVPDLNEAMQELVYRHVLEPFRNTFHGKKMRWLQTKIGQRLTEADWEEIRNGTWTDYEKLMRGYNDYFNWDRPINGLFNVYSFGINELLTLPEQKIIPEMKEYDGMLRALSEVVKENGMIWSAIAIGLQMRLLNEFKEDEPQKMKDINIIDEWNLEKSLHKIIQDAGWKEYTAYDQILIINWVYQMTGAMKTWTFETLDQDLDNTLKSYLTQQFLKVNLYDNIQWFNKESAELLVTLIRMVGFYANVFDPFSSADGQIELMELCDAAAQILSARIAEAEYHFDALIVSPAAKEEELINDEDIESEEDSTEA